jgi:hypothetical protein
MFYRVKWLIHGRNDSIVDPADYPRISEAEDFACSVLRYNPADLWIEDEFGRRMAEKQEIIDYCRRRGRKGVPRGQS